MDSIRELIQKVASEITVDLATVDDDDNLENIGFNSIDFINMVLEIEKQFQIFVKDEDLLIENFGTIAKINSYIEANK